MALAGAKPLFPFMQSQVTVRELRIGDLSKDRMRALGGFVIGPGGSTSSARSAASAPGHATRGTFVRQEREGNSRERPLHARTAGACSVGHRSRVTISTSRTPSVRAADRVRQYAGPTGFLNRRVETKTFLSTAREPCPLPMRSRRHPSGGHPENLQYWSSLWLVPRVRRSAACRISSSDGRPRYGVR